jgi:hypothetical protein
MPTGTLTFNLPEEQSDFNLASNASKWYLIAWDMDQFLRNKIRYPEDTSDNKGKSDEYYQTLQEVRDALWENMNDRGLDFDGNW